MIRSILFFVLSMIIANATFAQDSLLIENLKSNAYSLVFENGELSGEGFEFLNKQGEETPFFLIGESHGMAEIPEFTAALFRAFKKHGYQYFATETGPYTADFLQQLAAEKNWQTSLQSFYQKYPWSIPFYSWKEEGEILEAVVGQQKSEKALIWGLDQEFAAGFRMNFKTLKENATSDKSREVATKYYEMAINDFNKFVETHNPMNAFMAKVQAQDFEQLKTAFSGQPENLDRIRELEESIHIYQLWFQREGYQSNCLRAEMMKQHFWQYYTDAKKKDDSVKVMFKLGANHVYRGPNGLNVFDIGNFVSEMASQMKTSSFHLFTLARKGTQNAYNPFSTNEADKQKAFDIKESMDKVDVSTLLKATSETEWSVIDLKPLRKALFSGAIKKVDVGLEKLIWSYDAILVIPEVRASTIIE